MATVYKYCDAHGVKILQNLELKITPPNQFNDPFEFTPRVICSSPNRKLKRFLKDKGNIKDLFLEQKKAGEFKGSFKEYRRKFRELRPKVIPTLIKKTGETNAFLQKNYLDTISEKHAVLCMSSRRNSVAMWGHYGDKHRGIVISFDGSWSKFSEKRGLHPVKYVHERTVWDTSWIDGSPEEREYIEKLVFTKNHEWKYEDELRQLFTLEGFPTRTLNNGVIGHFVSIPPEIIMAVSLGNRCPPELEQEVRDTLTNRHLSHVKLDRAVLHETDFDLRFE